MSLIHPDALLFRAYWTEHHVTAGEYLEQLFGYLSDLKGVSPSFALPLRANERGEFDPLPSTLEAFASVMLPLQQKEDTWYRREHGPKQTTVTSDAYCSTGFYNSTFYTGEDWSAEVVVYGGNSARRSIEDWQMEFPAPNSVAIDYGATEFNDLALARRLFLTTVERWRPTIGWVATRAFRDTVKGDAEAPIGWLTYFQDAEVTKFLPSDVTWEQASTGGVLVCLGEKNPKANNPADVERSIRTREALQKHGKLNWRQSG